jgi:hypothetical protein
MARGDAISNLLRWVAQWLVGEPYVFYRAGLADANLAPVIDWYHLGNLYTTISTNISAFPSALSTTMIAPGPDLATGGIRLTLTRPPHSKGTINAGLVVLRPLPPDSNALVVAAKFVQLRGPNGPVDRWGVVVHAREGGIPDEAQTPSAIRVAPQSAPLHVDPTATGPVPRGVKLITPNVLNSEGQWFPDTAYEELFEKPPFDAGISHVDYSQFALELSINRWGPAGVASVQTFSYREDRQIDRHPELAATDKLSAAGVNVAILVGSGPVTVTVCDFCLIGMRAKRWISFPIVKLLATALMRRRFFRGLNARLVELACVRVVHV